MASQKTKISVTVKLKGEKKGPFSEGFKNLYAFARLPNNPSKVLGKDRFNSRGEAKINIVLPGNAPMPMEVEVSPISKSLNIKNLKTEKAVVKKFEKSGSKYVAKLEVSLNQNMYSYMDWLNEQFIVFGKLLSHYVDPETEEECTVGIPYSKVTLFEVDKERAIGPCLVDCMVDCLVHCGVCMPPIECLPDQFDCLPRQCGPIIECTPISVCPPILEGPIKCPPTMPCAPWAYIPGGIDERVRWGKDAIAGKAGLRKTMQKPVASKMSGPLKSPALPMTPYSSPMGSSTIMAIQCLPNLIGPCVPQLCKVSAFPWISHSKTELGVDETDANGNYFITFKRSDFLEAAAGSTQTENVDWDAWPDLLFEASRFIDGEMRVIYEEGYDQTRWDIQKTCLNVNLIVEEKIPGVSCFPGDDIDPSQTEDLVFHGIGNIEPGWIDNNGVITNIPTDTTENINNHNKYNEHVFGGTLDIFGQFKYGHIGKYYQVEYASASDPNNWKPIANETWSYSKYLGNYKWETLTKAPISLGTDYPYCYEIPDYADNTINKKTLLMRWRTWRKDGAFSRYPDGKYTFRVVLLTSVGNPVAGYDPDDMKITVTLDNTWPEADIRPEVRVYDKGAGTGVYSEVPECGYVASGDRYLVFRFRANDGQKHFRHFNFTVNRGAEDAVKFTAVNALDEGSPPANVDVSLVNPSIKFSDPNDNYPDNYTWLYIGKDYWDEATYGSFRPCAYNFRVVVRDRVTNGYNLIHWSDATLTLSIT